MIKLANNKKTEMFARDIEDYISEFIDEVYYMSNWSPEEIKDHVVIEARDKFINIILKHVNDK